MKTTTHKVIPPPLLLSPSLSSLLILTYSSLPSAHSDENVVKGAGIGVVGGVEVGVVLVDGEAGKGIENGCVHLKTL